MRLLRILRGVNKPPKSLKNPKTSHRILTLNRKDKKMKNNLKQHEKMHIKFFFYKFTS